MRARGRVPLLGMVCVLALAASARRASPRHTGEERLSNGRAHRRSAPPDRNLRLRGGEAAAAAVVRRPETEGGPREAAQEGAGPEEVVYPRDCQSLPGAIRRCGIAAPAHAGGESRPIKRRRPEGEDEATSRAHEEGAEQVRRLLILYGRHEVEDEALSIRARGAWSVRGIGDLSGNLDLATLGSLMEARAAGGGAPAGNESWHSGQERKARIVRQTGGTHSAALEADGWSQGRCLDIAVANVTWPLLPPDRYNEDQVMMQLGCARPSDASQGLVAASARPAAWHSAKIKRHKQIKSNPFEVLLEPPHETQVAAAWLLAEGTHGVLADLACLLPWDPTSPPGATIDVSGGPWVLESTRLECKGGVVLRLRLGALVRSSRSLLQGTLLAIPPSRS